MQEICKSSRHIFYAKKESCFGAGYVHHSKRPTRFPREKYLPLSPLRVTRRTVVPKMGLVGERRRPSPNLPVGKLVLSRGLCSGSHHAFLSRNVRVSMHAKSESRTHRTCRLSERRYFFHIHAGRHLQQRLFGTMCIIPFGHNGNK